MKASAISLWIVAVVLVAGLYQVAAYRVASQIPVVKPCSLLQPIYNQNLNQFVAIDCDDLQK